MILLQGSFNALREELNIPYAKFGACHNLFGNGILSRFPISFAQNHILQSRSDKEHARSLLEAQLSLGETHENDKEECIQWNIFVTHLEHISERVRIQQTKEITSI